MAIFKSFGAFDFNTFNLNIIVTKQTGSAFYDNINEVTGSDVEQDIAAFQISDLVPKTFYFGGSGLTFDDTGAVTAGTVKGISEFNGAITDFVKPIFTLGGITLAATDLFAAAYTTDTADDFGLLAAGLSGDDRVFLSTGNDVFHGFDGDDTIFGNAGSDVLYGGVGNDKLFGELGDDVLLGGAGNDMLNGGAGFDRAGYINSGAAVTVDLRLLTAQNTVGAGTDTLVGIESVGGSNFNDTISGNKVINVLFGGQGNDTLNGYEGNDKLLGGTGQDTLTGGVGRDQFIFDSGFNGTGTTGFDTITDFNHAELDKIALSKAVFTGIVGLGDSLLTADQFYAAANATGAHDASDRVIYNTTTGALYYDSDGNGAAAAVQFALIGATTHPALVASDILLVI